MKRSFLLSADPSWLLVAAGTGLIAATYGLVRLAYGLFLPDVRGELGLDVATAGIISGGASVVYCGGAILGFLTAARAPRALIVAAALSAAVGAFGMAAAPGPLAFAIFAIAGSAGAGLASPALVSVLQRHPATRNRPRAQLVVNAGTGPGLVVAGVLALVLLPDWRLAWAIAGVVTVIVACLVLAADRGGNGAAPHASAPPPAVRRVLPPASWYVHHRPVLAAALLMGFASAAVWTYGRTLLVESGVGEAVSVAAWLALGAGGTAVIATARWGERRDPRVLWMVTVCAIVAASVLLAAVPSSAPLALLGCAAFGWGYTAASGALIAWTAAIDPPRAPAGTALLFITLILGQAAGAGALGALIPIAGYPIAFLAAAAAAAAAAFVALRSPAASGTTPATAAPTAAGASGADGVRG